MEFISGEKSFELFIDGYEFPHLDNEPDDSDWLMVGLKVSSPKGNWSVSDPSLQTNEVESLASWLEKVSLNKNRKKEISFIEPVLGFSILENNQGIYLEINLSYEALPPWESMPNTFSLTFPLADLDLMSAANDLQKQLEKYPQRYQNSKGFLYRFWKKLGILYASVVKK